MARARVHDLDDLFDVAEHMVTEAGSAGLTLRGLAQVAGVSNGSIYHAFSSKEELLARMWLRAAGRFLDVLSERVRSAREGAGGSGADVVVQAALAPVECAERYPGAARLFFGQRSDQLFSEGVPDAVVRELDDVQRTFRSLLIELAELMWDRRDRVAVDAITACVVELPGGLVRRRLLTDGSVDPLTRSRVEAATRAILALPLPARPGTAPSVRKARR